MQTITILTIVFLMVACGGSQSDSTLKTAEPNNVSAMIYRVDDLGESSYYFAVTANGSKQGYALECRNASGDLVTADMNTMFTKIGFASGHMFALPSEQQIEGWELSDIGMNITNPALKCNDSSSYLRYHNVDGQHRYYLQFAGQTTLHHVGCVGLIEAVGKTIEDAVPISTIDYNLATKGDRYDLHCPNGIAPMPPPPPAIEVSATESEVRQGENIEVSLNVINTDASSISFLASGNDGDCDFLQVTGDKLRGSAPESIKPECTITISALVNGQLLPNPQNLTIRVVDDQAPVFTTPTADFQILEIDPGSQTGQIFFIAVDADDDDPIVYSHSATHNGGNASYCGFITGQNTGSAYVIEGLVPATHLPGECQIEISALSSGKVSTRSFTLKVNQAMCEEITYNLGTGEVCGAKLAQSSHCGVAYYKTKRTAVCGVELYQSKRSSHCGVELYRLKQNSKCGYQVHSQGTFTCTERAGDPEPGIGCAGEINIRRNQCNGTLQLRVVRVRGCIRNKPCIYDYEYTCRTAKSCRLKEHGVERWKQCRHWRHGIERYKACAHPSHGAVFLTCRHVAHGYESCRDSSFGIESTQEVPCENL